MTVTIADVLHRAADRWLAVNRDDLDSRIEAEKYSCCAVMSAAVELDGIFTALEARALDGLEAMGCDTWSGTAFAELGYPESCSEETQGARYMWLKFAALIAEEQDV